VGPVSGGLFPPFLTVEQHLAPAFERFGFGGPDGNRLALSDGHGPWNEPEWSDSMLNGSDGTGKSAGSMIPTTSNNSSGGANPTTMSLQTFVQSAPGYHQGFHDIQASQIIPYMAGNGTEFSTMGRFDGFQGPHLNNNFGGNLSQSNVYGYSWLPSVGTPGYDYYHHIQTLQQKEALKQEVFALREKFKDACSMAINFDMMSKKAKGLWGQMKEEVLGPATVKGVTESLDCCR
jgi:hypothetical protein